MNTHTDHHTTMLVTLSGRDRPGITRDLFTACSAQPVEVTDVDQIVMRDRLTIAASVDGARAHLEKLRPAIEELAHRLTMDYAISIEEGAATSTHNLGVPHFQVTMMSAQLVPEAIARITDVIADNGGNIDRIRRIARYPVTAVTFEGRGAEPDFIRRPLAELASTLSVDVAVQERNLQARGQYLVVLDVDSTVIQDEVIDLLAAQSGRHDEVAAVTAQAMAGEIDFTESLYQRVALLEGLPESVLDTVKAQIRLTPGARTFCRTLNRLGYRIAFVSGGFGQVVSPLANELGITEIRANTLEVEDGRLTGRVVGDVVDRPGKRKVLEELAVRFGIPRHRTIAIGDGANDVDMLEAAGLGIAFNAKPAARAVADTSVTTPYLDSVLFLMGITRDEIERADSVDGITARATTDLGGPKA
ncbi:MAG: phosphoserine phosphatase SerB [Rubrivirga sp.]|jgi:phosphoserine phosphatase|nr:phosphoserine phosphatase SerB [Rubrivirga sp.]|tara:strand:+ start:954 stop:2204 length:1251 start_codon:yes stop_codon:yes gene_type:complete